MLNTICTYLTRLPVTKSFVQRLSDNGFITIYLGLIDDSSPDNVILAKLKVVYTLSSSLVVPEFHGFIPSLIQYMKEDNQYSYPASTILVKLAKDSNCAKIMQNYKISDFFNSPINDKRIKKSGERIIQILDSSLSSPY